MRTDLRGLASSGQAFINGWANIPSGFCSEVLAKAGFDGVTVDLQHGMADLSTMVACFQGLQTHGVTPSVRAPWNEPGVIARALDAGARAVICPMINTRDEAERLASACLYPPLGDRSYGPSRARFFDDLGSEFIERANAQILCMPMIETAEGLRNLDEILEVEGVGGVYVGPADLGISIGIGPGIDRDEPEILDALDRVVRATRARGKVAGLACGSAAYASKAVRMGFHFVSLSSDSNLLLTAATDSVAAVRSSLEAR